MSNNYVNINISISEDIDVDVDLDEVFMKMGNKQKRIFLEWCLDDLGLELKEE